MIQKNKTLGLIGIATKAGKLSYGRDAVIENIVKKKISLVMIAEDTSERTKTEIAEVCDKYHIKLIEFETIENISKAIGKSNKAVIGIKDKNLAKEIENKIYGGDTDGENENS